MPTGQLNLRVPEETKARWQAAADDAGYSLSEFIRVVIDAHIYLDQPPPPPPAPVASGRVILTPRSRAPDSGGKVFKGPDPRPTRKR